MLWLPWLHAKIYVSENRAIISSLNLLSTSFELSYETGVLFTSASPEHAGVIAQLEYLCRKASVYEESACPGKRRSETQPPPSPAAPAAAAAAASAAPSAAALAAARSPFAQAAPAVPPSQQQQQQQLPFSPPPAPRPPFRPGANPHPLDKAGATAAGGGGGGSSGGGSASATKPLPSPATATTTGFCIKCKTACPLRRDIAPFCRPCYLQNDQARGEFCHVCGKSDFPKTLYYPLCGGCYKTRKGDFNFIVK